jgi:hypothetical protein
MKKKEFLTEAKRKQNLAEIEKSIVESFAKTFNKIKRTDENDGEDYEMLSRMGKYGINPYQEQPELKMPEIGDVIQNVDVTLQDGSTIKRTVKVVSMYPEKGEALVRTDAGGDAIVSIDSLNR